MGSIGSGSGSRPKRPRRKSTKILQNEIDGFIVKRPEKNPTFDLVSAPFHVPHNLCIDRIDKMQLDNTTDDTLNLIYNFRAIQKHQHSLKMSTAIIPLEMETKKHTTFNLPEKSEEFYSSEGGGVDDEAGYDNEEGGSYDENDVYHFNRKKRRRVKKKQLPVVTDLNQLINNKIKKFNDNNFVYLKYIVPSSSEFFTPYSLLEVPYKEVNKNEFYTISRHGVTYWSNTENHFTELDTWLIEYDKYCKLMKIKTFANFRIWKGFKVWQKTVQWAKFLSARNFIKDNLFIVIPALANALLILRAEIINLTKFNFVDISIIDNWYLFYFIEAQMLTYEKLRNLLIMFRTKMTDVLYEACHTAIVAKGFLPDDEALTYTTSKKLKEMMSFTDRARKRRFCIILANFLNYSDYMTITMLHTQLHSTFEDLSSIFKIHDALSPTIEKFDNLALDFVLEDERAENDPKTPFILAELVLKPNRVEVDPSREITLNIMRQMVNLICDAVSNIKRFQSDPFYNQFTEPSIMGRQEDRLCGSAPSLSFVLASDQVLSDNKKFIIYAINHAYDLVELYVKRFEPIRINYEIDLNTDPKTIKAERKLAELRGYCVRYNEEMASLEGLLTTCNIGLLQLRQGTFKEEVIPVCRDLLVVLDTHIPRIAIDEISILYEKVEDLRGKLLLLPQLTLEYVEYLRYISRCSEEIDKLDEERDYIYKVLVLLKDYGVHIDDLEIEKYLDLEDLIIESREILNSQIEKRSEFINKLDGTLQDDIKLIFDEVKLVEIEVLQPWLIDDTSNPEKVKETLQSLNDRLAHCQNLSKEYRKYQREFKIDVTRFDFLDSVFQEVKLRQTLWESLDQWNQSLNEWNTVNFHQLNMEDLTAMTGKILKNCTMLEKNLPSNEIIPKLRNSAELFKEKLPVIGYMRNPALKMRHWIRVEQILDKKVYTDESSTLHTFEEADAFNLQIAEELMEISGQASAEAGLEALLKKVENAWKEFELCVVPHRDATDVFILAGIDELQTVLDESNININTIAASRHVGPIKTRVDEWIKLLDLFAQTLEEWMNCQQSWIYLEAIFSAPDIQRQLPNEAKMFLVVDKSWKDILRKTNKMPLALPTMTDPSVLETMRNNNSLLEKITKCLEAYLEVKRVAFPRFYFLSNDELLEILAQTRNPFAVQPHLRKCFDAIAKLEFGSKDSGVLGAPPILTTDIVGMISPEGENIVFGKGLKARGPVEDWLSKVEEAMFMSIKRCMKYALQVYGAKDRSDWFQDHANQVVLTISQQQWGNEVHQLLDNQNATDEEKLVNMKSFEEKSTFDLAKLASIARTDINKLLRKVLCALITIDVHNKDTITNMVKEKVCKSSDFNWLKMLRYYWVRDTETIAAKMASANLPYFYEYLGAGGVLVITPLTDRCYLCLMGALQMDLGGAPAGPAGTGKTETTKDLAKALAKQCVVFNCSEGLDYKMMGRFFSGLAQSGAWCCFDEFNRIDIEVLSVIAQQLITIRNAKAMRQMRFMFEGREIKLNMSCAAFITMNPGYAGRTELPDNLKALFRPMSMMVPDYALIAEVILYSEGFEASKILAQKMVQMYKLCSEQLSQQDHYDFGMRAVKSVLVMAGALKRAAPDQSENITLIAALRDSNLPKFLADDALLFKGILGDLFPGVELPEPDFGVLQKAIVDCMENKNLQTVPEIIVKTIQLYETMCVRWGVMLVGPTGGGKTSVLHALGCALSKLYTDGVFGPNYRNVRIQTLNPKAVSLDELYGAINSQTLEWKDGLLGLAVRAACVILEEEHQWVVCDGPVDAVWIENMNTVLDDNKMLCLANSERIKLSPWVHMLFEVQDLSQASPATVSRCGMVYIDPGELGWMPIVLSWINTIPETALCDELKTFIVELYRTHFNSILVYARRKCKYSIHQVEVSKVSMSCTLIKTLTEETGRINMIERSEAETFICKVFIFSVLWSVGGNLLDDSMHALETYVRSLIEKNKLTELPELSLWEYRISPQTREWESWSKIVPKFIFDPEEQFFDMLVPTSDTARFGYIAELLFRERNPVMFTGDTGVGKSVLAKSVLSKLSESDIIPVFLNFSAQTSSKRTQEMIEVRLEKRKRTLLGAPFGKLLIVFVDDVNMPKLDTYGSQPPIELLRQFLDFKGLFDREKMFWKDICDVILGCGCAPPGGGRNPLTPRFVRHFALLLLPPPNNLMLTAIFSAILTGFLNEFTATIRPLAQPMVDAAVDIYTRIAQELLPTPAKSHYVFNLRDLSKCIQGVLQADSSNYNMPMQVLRLFYHEAMRVFHDRLINDEDKTYFKGLMRETCVKYFENPIVKGDEVLLYGDFLIFGQNKEDRIYEEIKDVSKLKSVLMDYLEDYNGITGKEMNLILFQDAMEHVIRLARLLRAERGNGLLVGLSGMGKQSLSRLSAHLNSYRSIQIELCRGYDHSSFHEDLRILYTLAGAKNTPTVFLITDTQIIKEEFLEDINNILNSGEVPNLFEGDEYEKVILVVRDAAIEAKAKDLSRDGIFRFFINRVRANLHVVICMSPVGDAFRRRCRMFPSLVNCCTIDWFVKWPHEALYSVAVGSLKEIAENNEQCENLAHICVMMHETIEEEADRFYAELRRRYYTTPSSYLELLKLYHSLLKKRADIIIAKRRRIANGLNKILETNELVAVMQVELQEFAPMLEEQSANMKELLKILDRDTAAADIVRTNVTNEEAAAKEIATATQAIADDAAADLEVAMPALKAAQDALKALNKNDINELKVFQNPPRLVQFVMEAICILLGAKPDWASAKMVMTDVNFLKRLFEYDAKHIPDIILKKIKVYVENKDFEPAIVEKVSKVAKSMCLWVKAIDKFAKVYRVVEPKVKRHEQAEAELQSVMALLKKKQIQLAQVESKIQALKDMLEEKNREFKIIQDNVDLTTGRLNRAGRLTSALSDEEVRWSELVEVLTKELWSIPGDVIVASACVAYLGAFSINYRRELTVKWVKECRKLNIPSSTEFSLVSVLGDAYSIRSWNMHGLPRDDVSTENGIIVTNALRWPLMIDPQEQANRWIRSMEKENDLRILKMTDPNMLRILEICIRQGYPLLIEELEEFLDPTLAPILGRMTFMQGGRLLIKLGESNIDYDENFRLYMTTKLSNPHYLPEVCIQVTLVNFLVTVTGLEDQLLADVVAIELPELEKQRSDLIVRINSDRQQLYILEDKVLKLLFSSEGNILDDEELVETLNEAKETSAIIAARLIDTEQTEAVITATREKYRPLAARGAILFFVVAMLAEIDPMYQYSLKYFTSIFCSVIQIEHPKMKLEQRLSTLMDSEIYAIYENISRGLFEKHKLVYSFLLAVAVEKQLNRVSNDEFEYLLRGPIGTQANIKPKPASLHSMNDFQWKCCNHLEHEYPEFSMLTDDIEKRIFIELGNFSIDICFVDNSQKTNKNWNGILSPFKKLMLINSVIDQKLIIAIGSYVRLTLGSQFTEAPRNSTLAALYLDTSAITPLVFVLSTGSDPMASLLRFAQDMNYMEKLTSISLGQGQGPAAESLIEKGRAQGHWIFLQNCHLATSWMPNMEKIVRDIALGVIIAHTDFRLFMSSMPSVTFPVSVLQNSLKVTNEPPKGLRANMIRALSDISNDYFENHILEDRWRAMIFGICMFHGVILERRKFGPLGWNITYEFSESDRECGLRTLDMFCSREDSNQKIPWDALEYINGEITWGGRVTDYWDQRCLKTILKIFSSPQILAPMYKYSYSGTYYCPEGKPLSTYREYAANLPYDDNPDIFGMHENANIVFQTKETQFFLQTMLEGMPRVSGGGSGKSSDDICLDMISHIANAIAKKVDADDPFPELIQLDSKGRVPSLTTVLLQETERFNKLLIVLHESLQSLEKAIKGFVVMSDALESIFNAFLNNQVPALWASKGYLSTKTLGYWVIDFQHRIDFIQTWVNKGLPHSSWLSGLFFPQSFLTGTLQTHARRHNLPIDSLKIDFEIMPITVVQKRIYDLHLSGSKETSQLYGGIDYPATGIIVHGLFIEAARWDVSNGGLCDARLGELMPRLPAVWFKPCLEVIPGTRYDAPLYKTQVRAGVLSTTGHSTNFVLSILLDSWQKSDFWILRGTALVTQVTE